MVATPHENYQEQQEQQDVESGSDFDTLDLDPYNVPLSTKIQRMIDNGAPDAAYELISRKLDHASEAEIFRILDIAADACAQMMARGYEHEADMIKNLLDGWGMKLEPPAPSPNTPQPVYHGGPALSGPMFAA